MPQRIPSLIVVAVFAAGGCNEMFGGGIKDVTHNARYEPRSPYRAGRVYRLTRDVRLDRVGGLGWLNPSQPALPEGDVVVVSGTRFRIDKVILDDRITDQQYHPQGVLLDGPAAGRRIDTSNLELGSAVETTPEMNDKVKADNR